MYEQAGSESRGTWGQFSLRALMIGVTVISILLALSMVPPLFAIVLAILYVCLAGILLIAIWQGRGWIRAFSIGAAIPYVSGFFVTMAGLGSSRLSAAVLVTLFMALMSGTAAAAFQGFLARRGGALPVPNLPLLRSWFTNDGAK